MIYAFLYVAVNSVFRFVTHIADFIINTLTYDVVSTVQLFRNKSSSVRRLKFKIAVVNCDDQHISLY